MKEEKLFTASKVLICICIIGLIVEVALSIIVKPIQKSQLEVNTIAVTLQK